MQYHIIYAASDALLASQLLRIAVSVVRHRLLVRHVQGLRTLRQLGNLCAGFRSEYQIPEISHFICKY